MYSKFLGGYPLFFQHVGIVAHEIGGLRGKQTWLLFISGFSS